MVISTEVQINAILNFTTCFLFQNILPLASHFNNGGSKVFTTCFLYGKSTFVEIDKFSPTIFKMLVEISISIENRIVKQWIIDLHFFSLEFQCH